MKNTIEKALQKQKESQEHKQRDGIEQKAEHTAFSKPIDESRKPHINNPSQKETEVSAPIVNKDEVTDSGEVHDDFFIDIERLDKNGHVSFSGDRKQINEEYREIKRKLLNNAFGGISKTLHNPNIIMVTSSRPSEGKTFTATNLAISIASEQDKTVLLVDADVLKPNVLNTLGLEKRKGLMEYLTGEVEDISDVLYHTNIDKLKIIPAGKSHHLSTEFLASKKMHETVDEFANRYSDRVVIFDTPPLIGINESAVLANFAGQAVIVVEENKAKIADIKMCVERLNSDMAIGFVVNKSSHNDTDGSGYYGYYYSERGD